MLNNTNLNSTLVSYKEPTFQIADYIVFSGFLAISGAVGIYFSCRGQKNTDEYFFGGKKMKPIPVGISTGVSFLAAGVMVGIPAEVYLNGYSFAIGTTCGCFGFFCGCMIVSYLLQPRGITSINQYIAKRFKSKLLSYTANILVILCIFHYMGVCILGSVIAFNSVTGGQVSVVSGLIIGGVVGIFYTTIGGLKAVVWTDVIQSGIMIGGTVVVIIKSMVDTPGGMSEIIRVNLEYGRIHSPVWSLDMTVRHTMWGLILGFFIYWGIWCIQPACVQRLCSTSCKRDSYIVAAIASAMFLAFSLLPAWAGINIFGYYYQRGCDVYAAGWISSNDIVLYYVRERLQWPGFQGLFIAALYSGSLSSLSSGLNAASAILWNDTIKPLLTVQVTEVKATFISKMIVLSFGVLAMIWCYILFSFGGLILQVAATIDASMYGSYFGLFLLAILFRYANHKGALIGLIASFSVTLWLGVSSLLYGKSKIPNMPRTIESCAKKEINTTESIVLNVTATASPTTEPNVQVNPFLQELYSVSYAWLSVICISVYLLVAMLSTGCTGPAKIKKFDEDLLMPFCRKGFWSNKFAKLWQRSSGSTSEADVDSDEDCNQERKTFCVETDITRV